MLANRGYMWSICGRLHKEENGQALPITLAALILGTLVITPFLSQASSSMIGSRDFRIVTKETYSADAGVEHGIWRLLDDGLAAQLLVVGSTVAYSLPSQVNGVTPGITVTKTQASGTAAGTITDTVFDSLEFDTSDCYKPEITNVSGNVFAIAYGGSGNDGFLITVDIAANGQIADTVIDTLEYDTSNGLDPDIIHVSGDVYAIAYCGSGNDGFL
ncbi:MAG: hypothetical protein JW856_02760, partial [Dehalococcoidales bacterium]|nr:hypothetical protein [Dehalococcoidales bacterium]